MKHIDNTKVKIWIFPSNCTKNGEFNINLREYPNLDSKKDKNFRFGENNHIWMNNRLYKKYSASQDYFYFNEIENLYIGKDKSKFMKMKQEFDLNEQEEFLLKFYSFDEIQYERKIYLLSHTFDIPYPLLFITSLINGYNDYRKSRKKLIDKEFRRRGITYKSNEFQDFEQYFHSQYKKCRTKSSFNLPISNEYSETVKDLLLDLENLPETFHELFSKNLTNDRNKMLSPHQIIIKPNINSTEAKQNIDKLSLKNKRLKKKNLSIGDLNVESINSKVKDIQLVHLLKKYNKIQNLSEQTTMVEKRSNSFQKIFLENISQCNFKQAQSKTEAKVKAQIKQKSNLRNIETKKFEEELGFDDLNGPRENFRHHKAGSLPSKKFYTLISPNSKDQFHDRLSLSPPPKSMHSISKESKGFEPYKVFEIKKTKNKLISKMKTLSLCGIQFKPASPTFKSVIKSKGESNSKVKIKLFKHPTNHHKNSTTFTQSSIFKCGSNFPISNFSQAIETSFNLYVSKSKSKKKHSKTESIVNAERLWTFKERIKKEKQKIFGNKFS